MSDVDRFVDTSNFTSVDQAAAPDRLVEFTREVEQLPHMSARRASSYVRLELEPGHDVVDVGCGTGATVAELSALVGPCGHVVGVDVSETMLAAAQARWPERKGVEWRQGDAASLPVGDHAVDAYRAERVYQHLRNPVRAIGEARRVLRPGGRIVLVDQDWESYTIDGSDRDVTRAVLLGFCDSLADGWAGRHHYPLLKSCGFSEIAVTPETEVVRDFEFAAAAVEPLVSHAVARGGLDRRRGRAWLEDLRERAAAGCFFAAVTYYVTSGRCTSIG